MPKIGNAMQTVQVRFTREQVRKLDVLVSSGVYPSRSEAVRNGVNFMLLYRQSRKGRKR